MSEATLEAPTEVTSAPSAVTPAPAPKLDQESFMRDSANLTPDVLTKLTPEWKPSKMVTQGQPKASTPAPTPSPATATPAPAAPAEPAAGTPAAPVAEVQPVAAPEVANTPQTPEDAGLAKNWKVKAKDAKEALVLQLVKNGAPLEEAYGEVYGKETVQAEPQVSQPEVTQPDPVVTADGNIQTLASKMAELTGKIDEAAAANDIATVVKLQREHAATMLQHADAVRNRESIAQEIADRQVSTAVEFHRQQESQSLESIREAHPELGDKKSEKRAQFNLMAAELEKNPAYGPNFRNTIPAWPEIVANAADRKYGWSKQTVAPVVPAPVAPQKTMNTQTNPLAPQVNVQPTPPVRATSAEVITPGSNLGGNVPTAVSAETFWRESANVTPDVLIQLMGKAPVPEFLRRGQNKNDPRRFGVA